MGAEHLTTVVANGLVPLWFASKVNTCLALRDTVCRLVDSPHPHSGILFSSSAFNTVDSHNLCDCLPGLQVNPTLILQTKDFLQNWPPHVRVSRFKEKNMTVNTGVPQGCVLSPHCVQEEATCSHVCYSLKYGLYL